MRLLVVLLLLIPSLSYAEDFDCKKVDTGHIQCVSKKDHVWIGSMKLNGGECNVPFQAGVHHRLFNKNEKFIIPGSKECYYVRSLTINTSDGKSQTNTF